MIPANIMLHLLPPYSPELVGRGKSLGRNSGENLQELRPQIYEQRICKLEEAALYIERNPKLVKSITSFPYIVRSL